MRTDHPAAVSFVLPIHLPSASNLHEAHWSQRHRRVKALRQSTCTAALAFGVRAMAHGERVTVTIRRVAAKKLDYDNLLGAAKPIRDGIADALGLRDDSDPRVTWVYGQARGLSHVSVEVRPVLGEEVNSSSDPCGATFMDRDVERRD